MNLELGLELGSGLGLGLGLVSSLRGNVLRCRAPTVVNWNNCATTSLTVHPHYRFDV